MINKRILASLRKIFERLLVMSFLVSLTMVGGSTALYEDWEEATGNNLDATSLDLSIVETNALNPLDITPDEPATGSAAWNNHGELEFVYDMAVVEASGSGGLCEALRIKVYDPTSTQVYDGELANFEYNVDQLVGLSLDSLEQDEYTYQVYLPENANEDLNNQSCGYVVESYAWMNEFDRNQGFWDVERMSQTINSGEWDFCEEGPATVVGLIDEQQGQRYDGTDVLPERSDPFVLFDESVDNFYALGFDGSITIAFEYPIMDVSGNDLSIREMTFGRFAYPLEKALVEVSQDGVNFLPLGEITNHDDASGVSWKDIGSSGFEWIQYVRLTDMTDASLHTDPQYSEADGFDVVEVRGLHGVCEDQDRTCGTIKGYKRDVSGAGLADWEIITHRVNADPVAELQVLADEVWGATTSAELVDGTTYLIEVEGVWEDANDNLEVDADYQTDDGWSSQTENSLVNAPYLLVNEELIDWGTFNDGHLYKYITSNISGFVNIRVADFDEGEDDGYADNNGELRVRIYDVTDEMQTTNENGYFESDNICSAGEYQVLEIAQDGWEQVSPANPDYYHMTMPKDMSVEYVFVNHSLEIQIDSDEPVADAKIVINEVYYDVDTEDKGTENKNEWIELYNPNNFAINLKGWYFMDKVGTSKPINPDIADIPANGFMVLSHDQTTWNTYWDVNGSPTIKLTGSQAWLNNGGDVLYLHNKEDVEIDMVAWEGALDGWNANSLDGGSIARDPLGHDTDSPSDWIVLTNPNPGTNPHSHIEPIVIQDDQDLIIGFENANGFDEIKYAVNYTRLNDLGEEVPETIHGEDQKVSNLTSYALDPLYIGTCSTLGESCIPHTDIKDMVVKLLYKLNNQILGNTTIPFDWQEVVE